eukprot:1191917-Prorocentrum_minimum.AAC.3
MKNSATRILMLVRAGKMLNTDMANREISSSFIMTDHAKRFKPKGGDNDEIGRLAHKKGRHRVPLGKKCNIEFSDTADNRMQNKCWPGYFERA